jgi:hypothetical protein
LSPLDFEVAFYALSTWRLARTSNQDELLAVACTIRNHVVPRLGQVAAYKSFYEACQDFAKIYPIRALPDLTDPAFVSTDGLLYHITRVYTCEHPDVTATHDHPNGARFFANEPDDWFRAEIIGRPDIHPLIGSFGSMQFYA